MTAAPPFPHLCLRLLDSNEARQNTHAVLDAVGRRDTKGLNVYLQSGEPATLSPQGRPLLAWAAWAGWGRGMAKLVEAGAKATGRRRTESAFFALLARCFLDVQHGTGTPMDEARWDDVAVGIEALLAAGARPTLSHPRVASRIPAGSHAFLPLLTRLSGTSLRTWLERAPQGAPHDPAPDVLLEAARHHEARGPTSFRMLWNAATEPQQKQWAKSPGLQRAAIECPALLDELLAAGANPGAVWKAPRRSRAPALAHTWAGAALLSTETGGIAGHRTALRRLLELGALDALPAPLGWALGCEVAAAAPELRPLLTTNGWRCETAQRQDALLFLLWGQDGKKSETAHDEITQAIRWNPIQGARRQTGERDEAGVIAHLIDWGFRHGSGPHDLLGWALRHAEPGTVGMLLNHGARLDAGALHFLAGKHRRYREFGFDQDNPILITVMTAMDRMPVPERQRLLHAPDRHGRTPLHRAGEHGHTTLLTALLKAGGKTEIQDRRGRTALHAWAMSSRSLLNQNLAWPPGWHSGLWEDTGGCHRPDRHGTTPFFLKLRAGLTQSQKWGSASWEWLDDWVDDNAIVPDEARGGRRWGRIVGLLREAALREQDPSDARRLWHTLGRLELETAPTAAARKPRL